MPSAELNEHKPTVPGEVQNYYYERKCYRNMTIVKSVEYMKLDRSVSLLS